MIKARALLFLDGPGVGGTEKPIIETYQEDDQWYVIKRGPSYLSKHLVVECDDTGLVWLKKHEQVADAP